MSPAARWPDAPIAADELILVTDLYQLTMLQTYFEHGRQENTVFEFFFRDLPPSRNFLVFAGLGTVLNHLERLRFGPRALALLEGTGRFKPAFLEYLADWRFAGEIWAVPEGTPVFAHEPVLQVSAPLPQAQLIETLLINQLHFQTLIASKAARVVLAARGRTVVDFGLRRAHGLDAGMKAARAAFIAGAQSTSNVLAGLRYGIPISGTMAHSAVQAFGDDLATFRAFAATDPQTVCLVDTFDTLAGVEAVIRLKTELGADFRVRGIRIDSGDIAELARAARAKLDAAGLEAVEIFASGGMDEYEIERILAAAAPVDGFGVGTNMDVSLDAPTVDCAYKLVEYGGQGRIKLSAGKRSVPGRKQVFRVADAAGGIAGDTVAALGETLPGQPLLRPVMRDGRVLPDAAPALPELQAHCRAAVAALPPALRALDPAAAYPVQLSAQLLARLEETSARIRGRLRG
ncbi:MAG: nicotinate phosphoribosyltransferase [Pseudomonadota bacterium]|uniref:nicotinate phosphoribosyltransferase n=1 Tax=Thermithiobacillus tepidarius TaxID=929 RepID=UPI0003FA4B10|nr:nicotinate phosphoribosyltransferase [Thermithiobacillus tepidarius]